MSVVKKTQEVGLLIDAHVKVGDTIRFQSATQKQLALMGVISRVLSCGEMTVIVVSDKNKSSNHRIDWYKYSAEYFPGRGACLELRHTTSASAEKLIVAGHEISAIRISSA